MYTLLLNGESRPLPPGPQVDLSPPHPCWPGRTVLLVMGAHPCSNAPPHQHPGRIRAPVFHSRHFLLSWDMSGKCLTVLHAALSETPVKRFSPRLKVRASPGRRDGHGAAPNSSLLCFLSSLSFSILSVSLDWSASFSVGFPWEHCTLPFLPWCHLHTFSPPPRPTPC